MGDKHAQPWRRARQARVEVMEGMSTTEARTAPEIAKPLRKSASAVDQMLFALEIDRCVRRIRTTPDEHGGRQKWLLTGKPLPAEPTSTADGRGLRSVGASGPAFDDRELCSVMSMMRVERVAKELD